MIIGASGSGKTNALLNLINEQDNVHKIYLYAKDLSDPKYELIIKNRKKVGIKHLNDSSAFIQCSNIMDNVYENIDHYNPNRKRKVLIVFDDMIAEVKSGKKISSNNWQQNKLDNKKFQLDDEINKESKLDEKTEELKLAELPERMIVSKKRFDMIKYVVQNARKNNLQPRPQHSISISFDESNRLIQDIAYGDITYEEALNKMDGINNNF